MTIGAVQIRLSSELLYEMLVGRISRPKVADFIDGVEPAALPEKFGG